MKIWARGSLPTNGDGGIEMYNHARYFTFTGWRFRGAPLEIGNYATDILALFEHLTAGKRTWETTAERWCANRIRPAALDTSFDRRHTEGAAYLRRSH